MELSLSLYDALSQILRSKDKLPKLSIRLELKNSFTASDAAYIEQYSKVILRIARALDILQGDMNVYYGLLLPTLLTSNLKLKSMVEKNWQYGKILAEVCLDGFTRRFTRIFSFEDGETSSLVAAILHPAFKMNWFQRADQTFKLNLHLKKMKEIFIAAARPFQYVIQAGSDNVSMSSYLHLHTPESVDITFPSPANASVHLLSHLNDETKQFPMLNDYPVVNKIFLIRNTPLTSFAAVERLFSFAGLTNASKRQ